MESAALTNDQMAERLGQLEPLLERTDVLGYAAARNTRALRTACADYLDMRDRLICELGEPETDAEGNQTGNMRLSFDSDGFKRFSEEMGKIASVESDVEVFRVDVSEAIGKLSGSQILDLDWMLEEDL